MKEAKEYMEKVAYNMAIHTDLTHFDSIEEIFEYIFKITIQRLERALHDTLKYHRFSRTITLDWETEIRLKGLR